MKIAQYGLNVTWKNEHDEGPKWKFCKKSATGKDFKMKKVQHGKRKVKKVQHEKSAKWKKSNMESVKWKKCNMKKV